MADMSTCQQKTLEDRLDLIIRGLGRADDRDIQLIKSVLQEKQQPSIFWGVAPTGRPHIGYLVPFVKIAELVEAGVEVKVLLADLYAFLVNYRYPRALVNHRREYYRIALSSAFEAILGLPASTIQFYQETSFASTPEFINDAYELLSFTSQAAARSPNKELAGTTMLSPLMVTIVQALDERYMDCDFQLGGLDQAGYYVYGDEYLPKVGHMKRHAHIMNKMLPGLTGTKMSASDPRSKIDLLDAPELVSQKILGAVCDGVPIQDNPILALIKIVLLPISMLRLQRSARTEHGNPEYLPFVEPGAPQGSLFSVEIQPEQFRHYESYQKIEEDFVSNKISSISLKKAVAKAMNRLLAPIRQSYEANSEWHDILKLAYPEFDVVVPTATDASENFCIPQALREISNAKIKLVPFNSTLHAAEFIEGAKDYPEIWTHGPIGPFASVQSFVSDFVETFVRPKTDMMLYAVIDKTQPPSASNKTGTLAGLIAYLGTSPANLCTEIGFVITLPRFQRTHVTSNAVGLLLNFALSAPDDGGLGLRRVQWVTSSVNQPSIRAAEKLGFTREGVMRWDRLYAGGRTTGKATNGKSLFVEGKVGHMNENDVGRDSVLFSMCWDDWFLAGKREHVTRRMEGDARPMEGE